MNIQIVKSYIEEYKREFDNVHDKEIYKWNAVKQFQENFNIEAKNFHSNLKISLSKADNLLVSQLYFPKGMLLENAKKTPEKIRQLFQHLYNEDLDYLKRIETFRSEFASLSRINFPSKKNHYQDHRAVVVYLTLMYPERYFFYKFGIFKDLAKKINYAYQPKRGRLENVSQYLNLCNLIRYEIEKDQNLLKLHEGRLDENCYLDRNHNILTQDFTYAVVRYLDVLKEVEVSKVVMVEEKEIFATDLDSIKEVTPDFTPRITNHIQNNIENKRIGDLGELWIVHYEKNFLITNGKSNLAKKVSHVAKNKGDGLGYDILSYDLKGNKKFIEVKTTKGGRNSTFFITKNELEKSKLEKDNYFLYRVYEYDEELEKGMILKIKGDLTNICIVPINYKVNLKNKPNR